MLVCLSLIGAGWGVGDVCHESPLKEEKWNDGMRLLVSAADFGTCCLEDLEANTFKILL